MGWKWPWYTITDSFDADFAVDEWHGHNVFFRTANACIARTSSIAVAMSNGQRLELPRHNSAWAPREMGRFTERYPQTEPYKWWNWHDNYDAEPSTDPRWSSVVDAAIGTPTG